MKFSEKYPWLTIERAGIFLLSALVLLVFGQTYYFQFVNYDDPLYVGVLSRTSFDGLGDRIRWAFTYMESGDWQPFVWFSWMLDQKLYGLNAGGYHLTNVLLHLLVVLFFFFFWGLATKQTLLALIAAAIFAIHPLRVESVVWVAERKDLLSAFWMMATLLSYYYYTKRANSALKQIGYFWVTLFFYACGLLTKPMLVTLPLMMLLLDYWPLERYQFIEKQKWTAYFKRLIMLIVEKIPFFFFAGISVLFTIKAIKNIYPFMPLNPLKFSYKIETAIYGYWDYIWNLFVPHKLTFFYPRPLEYNPGEIFIYAVLLAMISAGIVLLAKRKPYLLMGWGWFVVSLIPVSGLVRMGSAFKADRYTYFAHMGLIIAVVWLIGEWAHKNSSRFSRLWKFLVPLLIFVYAFQAFGYSKAWQNSWTLNEHGVKVSEENYRALNNLGVLYLDRGDYTTALDLFERTVKVYPEFWKGHRNIGIAHFHLGNDAKAFPYLKKAVAKIPDDPEAHYRLAALYSKKGNIKLAIAHYEISLKFNPSPARGVFYHLGNLYRKIGKLEEAARYYQRSIDIDPHFGSAYNNLANIFVMQKDYEKAQEYFQITVNLDPTHKNAKKMLLMLKTKSLIDKEIAAAN